MVKRIIPELPIFGHAALGMILGLATAAVNRRLNLVIHSRIRKDSALVTGASLFVQFVVITGVLISAANLLPFFDVDDLGSGISSAAFSLFYFNANVHFFKELEKFSEGRFDGVPEYMISSD